MGAIDQWRWTDDQGVQRLLGADELRAALASGRLEPSVLVWKRGMPGWVPARDVPELMQGLGERRERAETITEQQPRNLGAKAEPTPSIPPPGVHPAPGPYAKGRIDLGSSAVKHPAGAPRSLAHTMAGIGGREDDRARPDGGWQGGAARRDDEEQTVTRVRPDEDPQAGRAASPRSSTRPWGLEAARREAARARPRGGPQPSTRSPYKSVPTIRPRMPSDAATPPPPQRKPSIPPPAPKRSTPPPPVKSSAVLSDAFPSAVGTSRPRTDVLDEGWELEERPKAGSVAQPASHSLIDDDSEDVTQLSEEKEKSPPAAPKAPAAASKAPLPKRSPPAKPARKPPVRQPPERKRPPGKDAPPPAARPASRAADAPKREPTPKPAAQEAPKPAPIRSERPEVAPPVERHAPEPKVELPRPAPVPSVAPMEPPAEAEADLGLIPGTVFGGQATIKTEIPPPPGTALSRIERPLALAGAVAAVALVLVAFVVGRATAPAEAGLASAVQAKSGMAVVPLFARSRSTEASQRPCLMLRAPSMFASAASHRVPFETATQGERLLVGYARSALLPRGMFVDPAVGKAETLLEIEEDLADDVSRVVPLVNDGSIEWGTTLRKQGTMTEAVWVNAPKAFVLGFESGNLVQRPSPDGESTVLWKLAGKGPADAMRALHIPGKGTIVAYRQDNQIHYGALKLDGSVWHEASVVTGSGGIVGKPDLGSNGSRVAVTFADKPAADGAVPEIRWSYGELGKPLPAATVVSIPEGGPGGEAIAPAIAALSGGRWLLLWTEGRTGSRTLRAQTYDGAFRPVGQALRVSPATGSFGQGTVAAVGGDAVVLFLLATAQGYEVWGTVLQCR